MPCFGRRPVGRFLATAKQIPFAIGFLLCLPFALLFGRDPWRGEGVADWLTERLSDQEFQQFLDSHSRTELGRAAAEKLRSEMRVGDEAWLYSSPYNTWQRLSGRSGVCLIRDGKLVGHIQTLLN